MVATRVCLSQFLFLLTSMPLFQTRSKPKPHKPKALPELPHRCRLRSGTGSGLLYSSFFSISFSSIPINTSLFLVLFFPRNPLTPLPCLTSDRSVSLALF
ncbi:hypothetical protein ACB098_05G161300 [Castanea mollissima]